jgi:hypothetical protein
MGIRVRHVGAMSITLSLLIGHGVAAQGAPDDATGVTSRPDLAPLHEQKTGGEPSLGQMVAPQESAPRDRTPDSSAALVKPTREPVSDREAPRKPATVELGDGDVADRFRVKFVEGSGVRVRDGRVVSLAGRDMAAVRRVLSDVPGARLLPLFSQSEGALTRMTEEAELRSGRTQADLNLHFHVEVASDTSRAQVEALMNALNGLDIVEAVEGEPVLALPQYTGDPLSAPSTTPNFTSLQQYRRHGPGGIDANFAATVPGGRGHNVRVIDLEWAWQDTHEDLTSIRGKLIPNGTPSGNTQSNRDHGTATMGVLVGDDNSFGVTGLVPAADAAMVNIQNLEKVNAIPDAIVIAANNTVPGDVILFEVQVGGPNCDLNCQNGAWAPVEWRQAEYDAIKAAADAGRIIVVPAGNGQQDLDGGEYLGRFNRLVRDSGSIFVGAGASDQCTSHGNEPARARLWFSNFGSRLDVHGWGQCVVTTGYGDLLGGPNEDRWYTQSYSGTSSASPIVAGAAASLSSIAQQRGLDPLTSRQARYLLPQGASPQTTAGATYQGRIGPLPNLRNAIPALTLLDQNICPPDDGQEPNSTLATATPFKFHRLAEGIICADNPDLFRVELQAGVPVTVDLRFLHEFGDLDVRLRDAEGLAIPDAISQSVTDDEWFVYTPTVTGTYYVHVYGFQGAENRYRLSVTTPICPPDDQFEPNNTLGQATPVTLGSSLDAIACPGNSDFFAVPLTAGMTVEVDLHFSHILGDLDLRVLDSEGVEIARSDSLSDNEKISFTPTSDGMHYVWVYGYPFATASNRYTLHVSSPDAALYVPLSPARILDTRDATGGPPAKITAGSSRTVNVTGVGGVPATGVGAVVLNATAVNATANTFVTVHPNGEPRPTASTFNPRPGGVIANEIIAKVGTNGQVQVYNNAGSVDIIFDVVGWLPDPAPYVPLSPARILDTRDATGGPPAKITAGSSRTVNVTGVGGVPATGVGAVVLNATAVNATANTFVTVHPNGEPRPTASTFNPRPGGVIANEIIAKVGTNGQVQVYNNAGSVDIIFDVVGWLPDPAPYVPLSPARILDTRDATGGPPAKITAGSSRTVNVTGVGGVPATGVGAVVLNATAVNATANTFVTVHPNGEPRPTASTFNPRPGGVIANEIIAKVGTNGQVQVYNNAGSVDIIFDVVGWLPEPP